MQRLNNPRYHVAAGKLDDDLAALLEAVERKKDDDAAVIASHHAKIARKQIRSNGRHPKIADTVSAVRAFVEKGEKVLVFCDHHLPAVELTIAVAEDLLWSGVDARATTTRRTIDRS